jgi:hypothetical protein
MQTTTIKALVIKTMITLVHLQQFASLSSLAVSALLQQHDGQQQQQQKTIHPKS